MPRRLWQRRITAEQAEARRPLRGPRPEPRAERVEIEHRAEHVRRAHADVGRLRTVDCDREEPVEGGESGGALRGLVHEVHA